MIRTQNENVRSRNRLRSTTDALRPPPQISSSDTIESAATTASVTISGEPNQPRSWPRSSIACSEPTPITSSTMPGTPIGPACRVARQAQHRGADREREQPDRQIDEEDPRPREGVDDPAADHRPEDRREQHRHRPQRERDRALVRRERAQQDRRDSGTIGLKTAPAARGRSPARAGRARFPHSSDVSVNSRIAPTNSRNSPTRRASQPVSGTAIAAATEYELITHVPPVRYTETAGDRRHRDVRHGRVEHSMKVASDSANVSSASRTPRTGRAAGAGAGTSNADGATGPS